MLLSHQRKALLLQNLLGAGTLNVWQTISLILFVIALPCLAEVALGSLQK
jgi:hypothetical protein